MSDNKIFKITDAFNRHNKIKARSAVDAIIKLIDSDLQKNRCCPSEFIVESENEHSTSYGNNTYPRNCEGA